MYVHAHNTHGKSARVNHVAVIGFYSGKGKIPCTREEIIKCCVRFVHGLTPVYVNSEHIWHELSSQHRHHSHICRGEQLVHVLESVDVHTFRCKKKEKRVNVVTLMALSYAHQLRFRKSYDKCKAVWK